MVAAAAAEGGENTIEIFACETIFQSFHFHIYLFFIYIEWIIWHSMALVIAFLLLFKVIHQFFFRKWTWAQNLCKFFWWYQSTFIQVHSLGLFKHIKVFQRKEEKTALFQLCINMLGMHWKVNWQYERICSKNFWAVSLQNSAHEVTEVLYVSWLQV